MAPRQHPVHIHIHEAPDTVSLEGKVESLLASIDELAGKVQTLSDAVSAHVARDQATQNALDAVTSAYEQLLADDQVENERLTEIGDAVDQLTQAVGQPVPEVDTDVETPTEPEPTTPETPAQPETPTE